MGGGRAASELRGAAGVPGRPAPASRTDRARGPPRRVAAVPSRQDKIDAELEEAYDAVDENRIEALEQRRGQVAGERQAVEDALQGYASDVRAVAGAIDTVDRSGEAVIHRGLLREAEAEAKAKALRTIERPRQGVAGGEGANSAEGETAGPAKVAASLSDRLAQRLSAHRTAALQIEVARHPQVALAALVHGMVHAVVLADAHGDRLPLGVRLKVQDRLEGSAPDWPASPPAVAAARIAADMGRKAPAGQRQTVRRATGTGAG